MARGHLKEWKSSLEASGEKARLTWHFQFVSSVEFLIIFILKLTPFISELITSNLGLKSLSSNFGRYTDKTSYITNWDRSLPFFASWAWRRRSVKIKNGEAVLPIYWTFKPGISVIRLTRSPGVMVTKSPNFEGKTWKRAGPLNTINLRKASETNVKVR